MNLLKSLKAIKFRSNKPKKTLPTGLIRTSQTAITDSFMFKGSMDPNKTDIANNSYMQDADTQLEILGHVDATISDILYKVIRAAKGPWFLEVLGMDGQEHPQAARHIKRLYGVLLGLQEMPQDRFVWRESFDSVQNQLLRLTMLRGGNAAIAQLDSARSPRRILTIDPYYVDWKRKAHQDYVPYLKDVTTNMSDLFGSYTGSNVVTNLTTSFSSTHTSLDIPNFFYNRLDADPNHPFCISPLTPVLKTVFTVLRFLDSLQEVMDRVAWPRVTFKIIEGMLEAMVPEDLQEPEARHAWKVQERANAIALFEALKPGQVIVHGDWIEPGIMVTKDAGNKTMDPAPFLSYMKRLLAQGGKTYDSLLGGGDEMDTLQAFFQGKSIRGLQEPVEQTLSSSLSFFLRSWGVNAVCRFVYLPFEMRSESELETFRTLRIKNDLSMVSAGVMTPAEFSIRNTGTPLPKGKVALDELVNNFDILLQLNINSPEVKPSASDSEGASPGKGPANPDGRSDPDSAAKKGKVGSKTATGGSKDVKGAGKPAKPKRK